MLVLIVTVELRFCVGLSCYHLSPFQFQVLALVDDYICIIAVIVASPQPCNDGEELVSYSNVICAPVRAAPFAAITAAFNM